MLGGGFKAERLRVNLRLVINRLKLLEKKKTELAQKARKEIADYLSSGKDERARIRVEHIIREDYLVEAMEILELYYQLCAKYSKEYGKLCRSNQIGTVNDRLMHKLSVEAPPKILVERYLIEIAKNYNVPYEPDAVVMSEAPMGVEADLIDVGFTDEKKGGSGGGGGGGGFTAPAGTVPMPMPMHMPMPPAPFSYPPPKGADAFGGPAVGIYQSYNNFHPPVPGGPPPQLPSVPPTYESIDDISTNKSVAPAKATGPAVYDNNVLPELPSVPDTLPTSSIGGNSVPSDDIDFDDLSRRFEELKKKT
ncbi:IST1 protein, partial [Polypterus senegalus]